MNCSFCGAAFQVGVACCPSCGSLTAYAAHGQVAPQYKPASGIPQPPMQQPQAITPNGFPGQAMGGYQQYQQNPQNQAPYPGSSPVYNTQQMLQQQAGGPETQNMFPPTQQPATQAANGYNPPSQSASKLSDYRPASTPQAGPPSNAQISAVTQNGTQGFRPAPISNTMPGLKLSQYGQTPTQPGKLSDYKPATTQPGKLSDYKPATTQPNKLSDYKPAATQSSKLSNYKPATTQPSKLSDYKSASISGTNSLANYKDSSSIPTATPGSFSSIPSMPMATPGSFSMPSIPMATPGSFSSIPSMPMATPGSFSPMSTVTPNSFSSIPSMPMATPNSFSSIPSMPMATPGFSNTDATNLHAPDTSYATFTAHNQSGTQSGYTNAPNMTNPNSMASFFVPQNMNEGYNPSPQFGAPPMQMATPTPEKQGGLVLGTIVTILVIMCLGAAAIFLTQPANNAATNTAKVAKVATPVATVGPVQGPSGNSSVPTISSLFSNTQMTTGVDDNDKAKHATNSFSSGQTVYVSFVLNSKNQKGYVKAKWYKGKELLKEVSFPHDPNRTNGYFSIVYDAPTTEGSVELYWSTTANFSDAKLAQVVHFTVTAAR